jgi:hypothetical protein
VKEPFSIFYVAFLYLPVWPAMAEPASPPVNHEAVKNVNSGLGTQFNYNVFKANTITINTKDGKITERIDLPEKATPGKLNRLEFAQYRYLLATNPTELEVSGLTFERWAGDSEPYFTISIKNGSNLPAEQVAIWLLAPKTSGEKESRRIKFAKSHTLDHLDIGDKSKLSISKSHITKLPLAAKSEIFSNFNEPDLEGFELVGVGSSVVAPTTTFDSFPTPPADTDNSDIVGYRKDQLNRTRTLGILIEYKSIFGQKISRIFPANFYFEKSSTQAIKRIDLTTPQ